MQEFAAADCGMQMEEKNACSDHRTAGPSMSACNNQALWKQPLLFIVAGECDLIRTIGMDQLISKAAGISCHAL